MPTPLESLKSHLSEINALNSALVMMEWDQQTYMPRGSAHARAEHMSILSGLIHNRSTSPEFTELVQNATAESEDDIALLRVVRRDLALKTKIRN